ncbi:MAG: DUF4249 family protein [Sediminibacterium sp.]|nr:DUF4249 family protein [Sediminibacterium sp.]
MMSVFNKVYRKLSVKIVLVLALTVMVTACEDRVQITIEKQEKLVVIDAFINNLREAQTIRLTMADSYFSGKLPSAISGASVKVKDLTNGRIFTFTENNGGGNYRFVPGVNDTVVYSGHNYELEVKYNESVYIGRTDGRRTAKIDSVYLQYKEEEKDDKGVVVNGSGYKLMLNATDIKGGNPDYYWIKTFKNGKFYNALSSLSITHFGHNNEFDGDYFAEDIWVAEVNGKSDLLNKGDVARVEIHGISKYVYDFLELGAKMADNGGPFAVIQSNMISNITPATKDAIKVTGLFNVGMCSYGERRVQ